MSESETLLLVVFMLALCAFNIALLRVVGLPKWSRRPKWLRLLRPPESDR